MTYITSPPAASLTTLEKRRLAIHMHACIYACVCVCVFVRSLTTAGNSRLVLGCMYACMYA